ncbi:MAG: TIGR04053 family radical SAM/SPASM domain-containing protein [Lentisphaerae bacterium]|nr:TIGR04053 family radical SAM/SPASM domain-containing protein [Lentisphaerota bacterium]
MFYYEVTRACDLVCLHCRAEAMTCAAPNELKHAQALALIDQLATFPRKPNLVLTGGDPLKRADIYELIAHAAGKGVSVALTPSATPLATADAFRKARDSGVRRLGISLDGANAATHDSFRGWDGSFAKTLQMLNDARALEMGVQVNTSITRRNFDQIDAMAELLSGYGISMWSVFFLIPVGRGIGQERISPEEYEVAFERLWRHARQKPFAIKTTEAPHYRRYVMQQGGNPLAGRDASGPRGHHSRAPLGVGDGKGIMFVSNAGEIYPAGFLPLLCGRFPTDSVVDVYQQHPTFRSLRDPNQLKGKCGKCEYRQVCGGSRSRAYAVTGDPLAAEPDCVYQGPVGAALVGA